MELSRGRGRRVEDVNELAGQRSRREHESGWTSKGRGRDVNRMPPPSAYVLLQQPRPEASSSYYIGHRGYGTTPQTDALATIRALR